MKKAIAEPLYVALSLIMIALISVSFFVFYKNIEKNIKLSPEFSLENEFDIEYICYDSMRKEIKIFTIKESNKIIREVDFIVKYENYEEKYKCGEKCPICKIQESGKKVYKISSEKKPESIFFKINGIEESGKKVEDC